MTARRFFLHVFLAGLIVLGGCETSFEPYAEADRYFSVFGVLNVSDDRHWVRVEPLQDDRPFTADSTIDATATLTHVATGRQVALEKSRMPHRDGFQHNFIAEMDLRLGSSYRLVVHRSDGSASTATVTIPESRPVLSLSQGGLDATVESRTGDRLLFLTVVYYTNEGAYSGQYGVRASRTEAGYAASFDWKDDVCSDYVGGPALIVLHEVEAVAGVVDPSAPSYEGLPFEELFQPGVAPSNVENGYGYVAGVASDAAFVTLPPEERPTLNTQACR